MVLIMAAQAQKTDKKLEELTTSITRQANDLFALEQTVKRSESQIPKKTKDLVNQEFSLSIVNTVSSTKALTEELNKCEGLLGCIERWHK